MNRRDFLIHAAQATLGGIAAAMLPFDIRAESSVPRYPALKGEKQIRLFKGTRDGRILASEDGGKSWRVCTNLGKQCPVLQIYEQEGQVIALVSYLGYRFALKSSDGNTWYTVAWTPPQG